LSGTPSEKGVTATAPCHPPNVSPLSRERRPTCYRAPPSGAPPLVGCSGLLGRFRTSSAPNPSNEKNSREQGPQFGIRPRSSATRQNSRTDPARDHPQEARCTACGYGDKNRGCKAPSVNR
jgi:hypothetical protein